MKTSRRSFIRFASAAGVLAALPGSIGNGFKKKHQRIRIADPGTGQDRFLS